MRNSVIYTLLPSTISDQIKEDEMGQAGSTHGQLKTYEILVRKHEHNRPRQELNTK